MYFPDDLVAGGKLRPMGLYEKPENGEINGFVQVVEIVCGRHERWFCCVNGCLL